MGVWDWDICCLNGWDIYDLMVYDMGGVYMKNGWGSYGIKMGGTVMAKFFLRGVATLSERLANQYTDCHLALVGRSVVDVSASQIRLLYVHSSLCCGDSLAVSILLCV